GLLLRAGELHGIHHGSVLAVEAGGQARVTRSGPLSALVEPVKVARWPDETAARPVFLAAPKQGVGVWVDEPRWRAAVERVRGCKLLEEPSVDGWRVEKGVLTASGLAPRLEVADERGLEKSLAWIARGSALLGLASAPGPSLGLALEVRKLRGGKWEAMKPGAPARNGDKLRAVVVNSGASACDITLLYVDHHYLIASFLPDPARPVRNRVEPGRELATDTITVEARAREAERLVMVAVEAKGETPADYSGLAMPAFRKRPEGRTALGELLAGSVLGDGPRGIAAEHRHQLAAVSWESEP
ncbi:MAG: hypothetical protein K2W96_11160, partial [Gemmataceae bacterium]|nr:hypothetical protein [Gemmataceae bacterium]